MRMGPAQSSRPPPSLVCRGATFDSVEQAYYEQANALYEGGVDMFLVETIFDTLNAKAALYALERFFEDKVCPAAALVSGIWGPVLAGMQTAGQLGPRPCQLTG